MGPYEVLQISREMKLIALPLSTDTVILSEKATSLVGHDLPLKPCLLSFSHSLPVFHMFKHKFLEDLVRY